MMRSITPVLLALTLGAGIAMADEPAEDLPVGAWQAEKIGPDGVHDGVTTTLAITPGGHASGSGGCNSFSSPLTIDGALLSFGPTMSTKMMCGALAMQQERAFFDALGKTQGWSIDEDGRLNLLDADGATLALLARQQG